MDAPERILAPDRLLRESNGDEGEEPLEDPVASAVALDVKKARQGDQAAIARLIRQHSTLAYRVAFAILANQHDAEDAVQEAFIKVFRSLHQVRNERAFRTWVSRITANQANDALRRKCLQLGLPERLQKGGDRVADAPEDEVLRFETTLEVRQTIERLSPLQRATVLLYYSEEFSTKEVAVLLGKPVGSVRRLLSDAYTSLILTVELDAKHRAPSKQKSWSRIAVAGLVASVVIALSLPGVRAAATNAIRQVFHIGSAEYVVNSGSDPAPVAEEPVVNDLDPKPDSDNRWFYAKRGPLPAEGVAAVGAMAKAGPVTGDEFRLPAWLPENAPKRLQLPLESAQYDWPWYSLAVVSNGRAIMVGARSPMVSYREFAGTTQVDAKRVTLGGIEGLEVRHGSEISYYLAIDNVSYRVFGPASEMETVQKIAESLSAQVP